MYMGSRVCGRLRARDLGLKNAEFRSRLPHVLFKCNLYSVIIFTGHLRKYYEIQRKLVPLDLKICILVRLKETRDFIPSQQVPLLLMFRQAVCFETYHMTQ